MGAKLASWLSAPGLMCLLVGGPGPIGASAAHAQGTQLPTTATPAGNIDGQQAEQIARQAMSRTVGPVAMVPARVEVYPAPGGWIVIFHDAQARCIDRSWWPGACRGVSPQDVIGELYACVDPAGQVYGFGSHIRPFSSADAASCGIVSPPGTPDPARGVGPSGSSVAPPAGGFSVRRPTQTPSASVAEVPVVPEAGTGWLVGIGLLTLSSVVAWRRSLRVFSTAGIGSSLAAWLRRPG
jgi:hypothetical protein